MNLISNVCWDFLARRAAQFDLQAAVLMGNTHRHEDRSYSATLRKRARTMRLLSQKQVLCCL
jgi:tRNA G26 N,N-dimethylase Trm1